MHGSRGLRALPLLPLLLTLASCDREAADPTGLPVPQASVSGVAPLQDAGVDAFSGKYIVVLKNEMTASSVSTQAAATAAGGVIHHTYSATINGFAATLSASALEAVRRDPNVAYVAEDAMVHASSVQGGATWGLDRIDQRTLPLSTTYAYDRTGAGVTAYVMDTGIQATHSDFGGRASEGPNFVDGVNGDCNGHGTHVAGTIGSATWGVAKAVQLVSLKVLSCAGSGSTSGVVAGIEWITTHAVKPAVVNMSLGGGLSTAVNQALAASVASGVTYVVAAGNDNTNACNYSPASAPAALTVGATDSADRKSSYSNFGTCVDLFAPGTSITSTWIGASNAASNTISGTSMASPHVAGVAALYLQDHAGALPAEVASAILGLATPDRIALLPTAPASPNRLLYSGMTVLQVSPTLLLYTFVRALGGGPLSTFDVPDGASRPAFAANGGGTVKAEVGITMGAQAVTTSPTASTPILITHTAPALPSGSEWSASSSQPWLTAAPSEGRLSPGARTFTVATVDARSLARGNHNAVLTVAGGMQEVAVGASVYEATPLALGAPVFPISDLQLALRYFMIDVPAGLTRIDFSITGFAGDPDLYVRYGDLPTPDLYDCRPYRSSGLPESCVVELPPAGTYYVMLRAFGNYNNLTLSVVPGGGPPLTPASLSGHAASATEIDVAWPQGGGNEATFTLQRSVYDGVVWGGWQAVAEANGYATSHHDVGRTEAATYRYRIRACNVSGCSGWTTSDPVTTPPVAPTGVVVGALSGTSLRVAWTDGSSQEQKFQLYRREKVPGGAYGNYQLVQEPGVNVISFDDTGLTSGNVYQYRVRACATGGCSAFATGSPRLAPVVPAPPTTPLATVLSSTTIRVGWIDGSDSETRFELLRRSKPPGGVFGDYGALAPARTNATSINDTGLSAGSTYQYRIQACNAAGCSPAVTTGAVTTPTLPAAPTGVVALQTPPVGINITWTDASPNETRFELLRRVKPAGGVFGAFVEIAEPATNVKAFADGPLILGSTYQYQVRACNLAGCSAVGQSLQLQLVAPPTAPGSFLTSAFSSSRVDLTWADLSSSETRFNLYRSLRNPDGTLGDYLLVSQPAANATGFSDTGVVTGRTYRYRLRACNAAGCSSQVTSPYVTTP